MNEFVLGVVMLAAFIGIIIGVTIYVVGFLGFLIAAASTALLVGLLAGGIHFIHAGRLE